MRADDQASVGIGAGRTEPVGQSRYSPRSAPFPTARPGSRPGRSCMRPAHTPLADLATGLTPATVEALASRSARRDSAPAFQALLAAVASSVRATLGTVRQAEGAALNLRQRDVVAAVGSDLDALVGALGAGVSDEGACLSRRRPADRVRAALRPAPGWLPRLRERAAELADGGGPVPTWLGAAGAAVEALGQTAAHVATLGAAQPVDSSARALADRTAEALRAGRDALLAEVAKLVD